MSAFGRNADVGALRNRDAPAWTPPPQGNTLALAALAAAQTFSAEIRRMAYSAPPSANSP